MATPLDSKMPENIGRLPELAYNLWWSWNSDARELFRRLDTTAWRDTTHNPVRMLVEVSPERLNEVANDPAFVHLYTKVMMQMDHVFDPKNCWFAQTYPEKANDVIAYFSFEFGLHNTLPIYSGGLGILSGDHMKEASDLGLPIVGIGFMYPQGYFRQVLPSHGWQEAEYVPLNFNKAPIQLAKKPDGSDLRVTVQIDGHDVHAKVWNVKVGIVNLYLMDTDVPENQPWERELSARLYYGGSDMRLKQEMLLGLGGVRIVREMGLNPAAWHMNEGHSAFMLLELLREKTGAGISFDQAAADIKAHTVFTTHTPVPAGHDAFEFHMMEKYFGPIWEQFGISKEQFLELGANEDHNSGQRNFNMTVLPLNMAGFANGVSKLHGEVSREMWYHVAGVDKPEDSPIGHVTNGIHVPTWIANDLNELYSKYLGPDWLEKHDSPAVWQHVWDIPDELLWNTHLHLKRKLMGHLRQRERTKWVDGRHDANQVMTGGMLFDPEALTIGFARRFATYKRANLIFRDLDRIKALLLNTHRPVQLLFAGKAHPADDPGKHYIQEIYNFSKANHMGGRVAIIEDYEMHLARFMKQGVDVWLNNPRRPREASGTSGMKASLNGIPNLSVFDGWWVEGYNGANGWVIGDDTKYDNLDAQDWADANSMYESLENEIIPLYYDRDRDGIPRGWVRVMKEAIRSNAAFFSMRRMVKEYTEKLYLPAM